MIPEEGTALDFKRAMLQALPPIPRYREVHWRDNPIVKWGVVFNGAMGTFQYALMAVDFIYGVSTWGTWSRIPLSLFQFGCVWFMIVTHRRSEMRRAIIFEELRTYYQQALDCGAGLLIDNIEQRMANMLRRRARSAITDWKVQRRNKRHLESRQCPCCLQIAYGMRIEEPGAFFTQTVYTFLETCPFCGWDWS